MNKKLLQHNLATKVGAKETFDTQREKIKNLAYDMPELVELWEFFVGKTLKLIKK